MHLRCKFVCLSGRDVQLCIYISSCPVVYIFPVQSSLLCRPSGSGLVRPSKVSAPSGQWSSFGLLSSYAGLCRAQACALRTICNPKRWRKRVRGTKSRQSKPVLYIGVTGLYIGVTGFIYRCERILQPEWRQTVNTIRGYKLLYTYEVTSCYLVEAYIDTCIPRFTKKQQNCYFVRY